MRYFFRALGMAAKALSRNIMRSTLTTLGVIMGVAAVIAIREIGQGASKSMQETITSMGSNQLLIFPGSQYAGGVSAGAGSAVTLTPDDAAALNDQERCPSVIAVAPLVRIRPQVIYNSKNWQPNTTYGTTPDYLVIRNWTSLTEGIPFSDQDVAGQREVCLVGQTVAKQLFGNESPVNKKIRINNKPFTVVGVLSPKGANSWGQDQDDVILAPWTTVKFKLSGQSAQMTQSAAAKSTDPTQQVNSLSQLYPNTTPAANLYPTQSATQAADTPLPVRFVNVDQIIVTARSAEEVQAAMDQITEVLKERHHIRPGQSEDFQIRDLTEIGKAQSQLGETMGILLLVVAGVALLVGGVFVMAIMLVSVTERTREIGLRMAVGARPRDILVQFLVEAALVCLMGGFIGIVLGRLSSISVWWIMHWPVAVSLETMAAAVGVSAAVGLIFGFYPAWKASRLDPIEALRYE
jgi:ABC-type antimicrobial peptide transport system permease subunit